MQTDKEIEQDEANRLLTGYNSSAYDVCVLNNEIDDEYIYIYIYEMNFTFESHRLLLSSPVAYKYIFLNKTYTR